MKIETVTSITYVLRLTEDELAAALVDPSELQDELRAARAHQRQTTETRKNNLYLTAPDQQILQASKKQSKRVQEKSFLAGKGSAARPTDLPRVLCPRGCGKMIVDTPKGWGVHNAHSHPELRNESKPKPPAAHIPTGNTFPLSVRDAA